METNHTIYWSQRKAEALKALEYAERQLVLGSAATRIVMNDSLQADIGESNDRETV